MESAGIAPEETVGVGVGGMRSRTRAMPADDWAAAQDDRASRPTPTMPRAACTTWR